jgi:hypothetical protein
LSHRTTRRLRWPTFCPHAEQARTQDYISIVLGGPGDHTQSSKYLVVYCQMNLCVCKILLERVTTAGRKVIRYSTCIIVGQGRVKKSINISITSRSQKRSSIQLARSCYSYQSTFVTARGHVNPAGGAP